MRPVVLVMTTVHWPDDTRIRERLIRTLCPKFDVIYAARSPGPTDRNDLHFVELNGGRAARNFAAVRVALSTRWDVLVIHDPELLLCGLVARAAKRRPVVWDVHEDVPASAYTRAWVPKMLRGVLSSTMKVVLRLVEPVLTITLAEAGYRRLFRNDHPTFPNNPDTSRYPDVGGDPEGPAVYLGDVTLERGADLAVEACSRLGVPLRLVGRITPETEQHLRELSGPGGNLAIEGLVPNIEAVAGLSTSSVGLAPLRDLPNYRHSQPTKILEYLAMGLPVVASDLPGTRQLVDGLEGVFVFEPGDSRSLADAISRARSPDVLAATRAQAPAIRSRFRWPADHVLQFYRSLL